MNLRKKIEEFIPFNEQEEKDKIQFLEFIDSFDDTLTRDNIFGHFTASAFVVNKERNKMVVVYHIINDGWIYPGGHADGEEDLLKVAVREVEEETNICINNPIDFLASKKVSKNKLAIMFYAYFDGDISNFKSNTFKIEWPKNSNQIKEFPEMDKLKWFTSKEAKKYIHPTQKFFIDKLEEKLCESK